MLIDIILLVLVVVGFIMGYRSGLLTAIFALVSLFIGVAVAVKFTAITTQWLYTNTEATTAYLPFIVFIVLFVLVVLAIRGLGKLMESILDSLALGIVNRLAGGFLWCLVLVFLFSIFLWFADSAGMIQPALKEESHSYVYVHLVAPLVLDFFADLIPWFEGMFDVIAKAIKKL